MSWFGRFSPGKRRAGGPARLAREVAEVFDPYQERTVVVEDDRAMIVPGKVLENLLHRMERIDLDPDTPWAAEDLLSQGEMALMFAQLRMGPLVVTETAWYARKILSRWPLQFVEHPISAEARIEMFQEEVKIEPFFGDIARKILNRALANPDHVDAHPELDELDAEQLMGVWLALVFWFGIKSMLLNKRT